MRRPSFFAAAIVSALSLLGCGDAGRDGASRPTGTTVRACADDPGRCGSRAASRDAHEDCADEPAGCDRPRQASGPVHDSRDCNWQIRFRGIAAGTGVRFARFQVTNGSPYACRLSGVPTVRPLDDRGHVVATRQATDTSVDNQPPSLRRGAVAAHGRAQFVVTISNNERARGEDRRALLIRLPHTRRPHRVSLSLPGDDHVFDPSPRSGLSVTPVGSWT